MRISGFGENFVGFFWIFLYFLKLWKFDICFCEILFFLKIYEFFANLWFCGNFVIFWKFCDFLENLWYFRKLLIFWKCLVSEQKIDILAHFCSTSWGHILPWKSFFFKNSLGRSMLNFLSFNKNLGYRRLKKVRSRFTFCDLILSFLTNFQEKKIRMPTRSQNHKISISD